MSLDRGLKFWDRSLGIRIGSRTTRHLYKKCTGRSEHKIPSCGVSRVASRRCTLPLRVEEPSQLTKVQVKGRNVLRADEYVDYGYVKVSRFLSYCSKTTLETEERRNIKSMFARYVHFFEALALEDLMRSNCIDAWLKREL